MTPIKVFIGYSRTDNDYLQALKKHLTPLEKAKRINVWYDGDLSPGDEWDAKIKHNLATADLILLLISIDALGSDYFNDIEMEKALQRDKQKEAIVIPIIVRPCLWDDTRIHKLQALPQDGKAIILWQHHDVAYDNIVRGIKVAIENLLKTREIKTQLATLKASILQLLEQNKLAQAQQALQKAHTLNLPDPELDKLQTAWQQLEDKRLEQERLEQEHLEKERLEKERLEKERQRQAYIAKLPQPIQQLIKDLVAVEGGSFMMGSPNTEANRHDNEYQHHVTLSSFYISKYQVTQAQWEAVMGILTTLSNPSHFKGDNLPVESVSWDDIQVFVTKLNQKTGKNFRLPTEAEWEYAARGGNKSQGYIYAGSNNLNEVAWYRDNSNRKTYPVGRKKPNELGIYDMSGNIWEWCQDWYDEDYYKNSPTNNPTGPTSGSNRVLRSCSWYDNAAYCRVANRDCCSPDYRFHDYGFRLVCVL